MTTDELEQLIEGQIESQNLDFKTDCPFDEKSLAKDIIAMSNVRDGGLIIIGVEEIKGQFSRKGVSESNMATYNIDIMRDKLASFADPPVDFSVSFPRDAKGKIYVVIKVFSFRETPILAKKGIPGIIIRNCIYYRNTNKRIESAPVSNTNDLRDIIELAAIRLIQRRKSYGYSIPSSFEGKLKEELTDLPDHSEMKKIIQKGHWEIHFLPLDDQLIPTLKECKEIIGKAEVRLNWFFPIIPDYNTEEQYLNNGSNFIQVLSNLGARKEFWQFYKSGQFRYISALPEDWYIDHRFHQSLANEYPPGEILTYFTSVVHLITSVIEFLSRLCQADLYKTGVHLDMSLNNAGGRTLRIDNPEYTPFLKSRQTISPQLHFRDTFSNEELATNPISISNRIILCILDSFSYYPPPTSVQSKQEMYLTGRG